MYDKIAKLIKLKREKCHLMHVKTGKKNYHLYTSNYTKRIFFSHVFIYTLYKQKIYKIYFHWCKITPEGSEQAVSWAA